MTQHAGLTLHRSKGKALLAAAVLLVAAGIAYVIASSLGGSDGGDVPSTGSFGPVIQAGLDKAVEGLCEVRSGLAAGDTEAARAAFYDKAHLFLHQLAAEVQEKDTERATNLLIAKYRVESLLPANGAPPTAAATGDETDNLLREVGLSAAILDFAAPDCTQ